MTRAVPSGLAAVGMVAAVVGIYVVMAWDRLRLLAIDHGWFLQVAQRVLEGETLYEDVLWGYGPLPVLLITGLVQGDSIKPQHFSTLQTASTLVAVIAVYWLHRLYVSSWTASAGVLLGAVGFSALAYLLSAYTPSITLGVSGMLTTLLGLLLLTSGGNQVLGGSLISLGLATSLLSKPEYAFGAAALLLCALGMLAIQRSAAMRRRPVIWTIVLCGVLGAGVALVVYGQLAVQASWQSVWAGMSGYEQLQVQGHNLTGTYQFLWTGLVRYFLALLLTAGIVVATYRFLFPEKLGDRDRRLLVIAAIVLIGFHLIGVVLWESGWAPLFFRQPIEALRVAVLAETVRAVAPRMPELLHWQLEHVMIIGMGIGLVIAVGRWFLRVVRRQAFDSRLTGLVLVLVYANTVELRHVLFGTGPFKTLVGLLACVLLAGEFPRSNLLDRLKVGHRPAILTAAVIVFCVLGLQRDWRRYLKIDFPVSGAHGKALVEYEAQSFVNEVAAYIEQNTAPEESFVVLGPFPGLHYVTGRPNPFRQDTFLMGLGDNARDAQDFIDRLGRFRPCLILVPQGHASLGVLQLHPRPQGAPFLGIVGHNLFGDAAAEVETYVMKNYQLDTYLGSENHVELAAFKLRGGTCSSPADAP